MFVFGAEGFELPLQCSTVFHLRYDQPIALLLIALGTVECVSRICVANGPGFPGQAVKQPAKTFSEPIIPGLRLNFCALFLFCLEFLALRPVLRDEFAARLAQQRKVPRMLVFDLSDKALELFCDFTFQLCLAVSN